MLHVLDGTVFELPQTFEDRTQYIYASKDDRWVLRITPMPEARDPESALELAKDRFTEFFEGDLIYIAPMVITTTAGATVKGYEGEINDPRTSPRPRFALFVVHDGSRNVVVLLLGERAKLLREVARIHASVRFLPDTFDPLMRAAPGMLRRQAECISVEIPADWAFPRTLLFNDVSADDVSLLVSSDEPPSPEGAISLEEELPAIDGDRVTLLNQSITRARPNDRSWTGDYAVEHTSALGTRTVEVRKASVTFVSGKTLTAHGKALQKNAGRLANGWESFLQTVHEIVSP